MLSYVVAGLLASAGASASPLVNGDFSTGDLSGWTSNGSVNVIDWGFNTTGSALTGDLFAGLGTDVPTTLTETFHLDAGDTFTGQAQWIGWDYLPNNDYGSVSIVDDTTTNSTTLFSGDIATYGDFGSSAVNSFQFIAPTTGDYTITAAVANAGDNSSPSELQVANFAVTAVPVPSAFWLFGTVLAGFAAGKRRFGNAE